MSNQIRECFFTRTQGPRDHLLRHGPPGLQVDGCQFLSNESQITAQNRKSIVLNSNNNDLKIRGNRVRAFQAFRRPVGLRQPDVGNHYFHGDGTAQGVRTAGIIFTQPNCQSILTGNYIDNAFTEWTNEHTASPALGQQFSFGGLTLRETPSIVSNPAPWFSWIVIKPYGPGHFVQGFR